MARADSSFFCLREAGACFLRMQHVLEASFAPSLHKPLYQDQLRWPLPAQCQGVLYLCCIPMLLSTVLKSPLAEPPGPFICPRYLTRNQLTCAGISLCRAVQRAAVRVLGSQMPSVSLALGGWRSGCAVQTTFASKAQLAGSTCVSTSQFARRDNNDVSRNMLCSQCLLAAPMLPAL